MNLLSNETNTKGMRFSVIHKKKSVIAVMPIILKSVWLDLLIDHRVLKAVWVLIDHRVLKAK